MAKKKTWLDKLNEQKSPQIKRIDFSFADVPAGSQMLITTPQLIEAYIKQIGAGMHVDTKIMRKDLAIEHRADCTCPVTTGIFLRIVAEANYEKLTSGEPVENITPFWRVIDPDSPLANKLTFGKRFLEEQIQLEKNK
ncbi:MAG: hypothetical protein MUC81_05025 [Bacteroidia bacterium]|jgi:hypothetical protein|nr:hypothetical protein [Bacteroidia bacterium]